MPKSAPSPKALAALQRLEAILDLLTQATCYHGMFPHFIDGRTGATIPFGRKDDGTRRRMELANQGRP